MKKTHLSILLFFTVIAVLFLTGSFDNKKIDTGKNPPIKNTLKSVSLFKDTVGVEASQLFADMENINAAIAEIGYPDAGYKIWEVRGDGKDFRFMVEGYWPDLETYRKIHDHELYKKAIGVKYESWAALKSTWYNKFDKVH